MTLNLIKPILYLITRGETVESTTSQSAEFESVLTQVSAAVAAGIPLIQLREKRLTARVLFELTERAVSLSRGSATRVLVNDRADIARAGGAAGVHLTTQSLRASTLRRVFDDDFLIGASTHSIVEARTACDDGADFVVFGPVFPTLSKSQYGAPPGIPMLTAVAETLRPFPIIALGGISSENAVDCLRAGAAGVAGISLFNETSLTTLAARIKSADQEVNR